MTYKPSKLGQTDPVFSLSAGLHIHDYRSLRVAVMICAILVNTQRDTHRDTQTDIQTYRQLLTSYTISSAS